ncbi:hypothetical protein LXL04_026619 [Taraxacum kok-saghyz]
MIHGENGTSSSEEARTVVDGGGRMFDGDVSDVKVLLLGSFENSYIPENSPNFLYLPNRYSFQKTDFGTLQNVEM